jgi:D-alanine-D-alanine ligase
MVEPMLEPIIQSNPPPTAAAPAFAVPQPQSLGKVAVLMGGRSSEREVSLMSGTGVLQALLSRGVDAHRFDPASESLQALQDAGFQRAFIALHGRYGEDGTIQGALELLGIPYTGSGVMASAIAMDKVRTKQIWIAQGLPTPRYLTITGTDQLATVAQQLGLPLIVKPPHEGSTIGITKVTAAGQLDAAYAAAARLDREVMAEAFVEGRELTVAVLGSAGQAVALPIVEIRAPQGNYDYQNKYFTDDTEYLCPAPLPEAAACEIARIAVAAYQAIGCEGWGRVDFMLSAQGDEPYLLEVNTAPGMTGHSLVPMAARAVGLSYEDLVLIITGSAALKVHGAQGGRP